MTEVFVEQPLALPGSANNFNVVYTPLECFEESKKLLIRAQGGSVSHRHRAHSFLYHICHDRSLPPMKIVFAIMEFSNCCGAVLTTANQNEQTGFL